MRGLHLEYNGQHNSDNDGKNYNNDKNPQLIPKMKTKEQNTPSNTKYHSIHYISRWFMYRITVYMLRLTRFDYT